MLSVRNFSANSRRCFLGAFT